MLSGSEKYQFDRRQVALKPGEVLLVNAGETYASRIDRDCESISVFFCEAEVHEAASSLMPLQLDTLDMSQAIPEIAQIACSGTRSFRRGKESPGHRVAGNRFGERVGREPRRRRRVLLFFFVRHPEHHLQDER